MGFNLDLMWEDPKYEGLLLASSAQLPRMRVYGLSVYLKRVGQSVGRWIFLMV
jgi:hypothetical protein